MTVDGTVVTQLGSKADPATSEIAVDGKPITLAERVYALMLNKPAGYLSTREDDRERRTVMDFVDPSLRSLLYPVGRLDFNSTGLILLTNDGPLAFRLMHPSYHVPKTYLVTASAPLKEAEVEALRAGVELEDGPTAPAEVTVHPTQPCWLTIVLREGRKRQIRRMLHAVGHEVEKLHRVALGPLSLGDLEPGQIRPLTAAELNALRAAVDLES